MWSDGFALSEGGSDFERVLAAQANARSSLRDASGVRADGRVRGAAVRGHLVDVGLVALAVGT